MYALSRRRRHGVVVGNKSRVVARCGTSRLIEPPRPNNSLERLEQRTLLSSAMPAGPEFRVNTYTSGSQGAAGVAMDANGNFVCTWFADSSAGAQSGIYAQRYNAAGAAQGGPIKVGTSTTGPNGGRIAMDPAGDFVMIWVGNGLGDSFSGVYAQRFN